MYKRRIEKNTLNIRCKKKTSQSMIGKEEGKYSYQVLDLKAFLREDYNGKRLVST